MGFLIQNYRTFSIKNFNHYFYLHYCKNASLFQKFEWHQKGHLPSLNFKKLRISPSVSLWPTIPKFQRTLSLMAICTILLHLNLKSRKWFPSSKPANNTCLLSVHIYLIFYWILQRSAHIRTQLIIKKLIHLCGHFPDWEIEHCQHGRVILQYLPVTTSTLFPKATTVFTSNTIDYFFS